MVKKVQLSQNRWSWVDDEDFERVDKYLWSCSHMGGRDYGIRGVVKEGGKRTTQLLHRFVIGEENIPKGMMVDHIDGDGLDNRKCNLRVVTSSQNNMNKIKKRTKKDIKTSEYKGVYWDKARSKWRSHIVIEGKMKFLGRFDSEIQAAMVYDEASEKYHGEYANNNGLLKKE